MKRWKNISCLEVKKWMRMVYKMLVTDKQYFMEKKLVEKLDLMVKRMEGSDDNVVCIDGDEGQGKTNFAVGICYYIAYHTGRTYTPKENIFFDLDVLIEYASKTKEKIIHWDEGALGGLSAQWWRKNQQKFIQLLMVARKKKHFIIICIPRFYKLNEYIVVDRSIALIHVYSRKNIKKGRFCYYTKPKKELLAEDYRRRHVKNYRKHKSFWGSFLEYSKIVWSEEEEEEYERKKDEAILSIYNEKEVMKKDVLLKKMNKQVIRVLQKEGIKIKQSILAEMFGTSVRTVQKYFGQIKEEKNTEFAPQISNMGLNKGNLSECAQSQP